MRIIQQLPVVLAIVVSLMVTNLGFAQSQNAKVIPPIIDLLLSSDVAPGLVAYAFVGPPNFEFEENPEYELAEGAFFNVTGGGARVFRESAGNYIVAFDGVPYRFDPENEGGISDKPHVQLSTFFSSAVCALTDIIEVDDLSAIRVRCADVTTGDGAPTDAYFIAEISATNDQSRKASTVAYSYVFDDVVDEGLDDQYKSVGDQYHFNPTGQGVDVQQEAGAIEYVSVRFNGMSISQQGYAVKVTPLGESALCTLIDSDTDTVGIFCADSEGGPSDSFVVSVQAVEHKEDVKPVVYTIFASEDELMEEVTYIRPGLELDFESSLASGSVGFTVSGANLGIDADNDFLLPLVHVSSVIVPGLCRMGEIDVGDQSPPDIIVEVICVDETGAPALAPFSFMFEYPTNPL